MDLEELKVKCELCKVGSITDAQYLEFLVMWVVCELEKKADKADKEEPKIEEEEVKEE